MTNLNWQDLPRKSTIKCGAGIYSERFRLVIYLMGLVAVAVKWRFWV